jgi:hypothetical protein
VGSTIENLFLSLFLKALLFLVNISVSIGLLVREYFSDKIFSSLVGTALGAGLAFGAKWIQDRRDEVKRQKAAANFALFALTQQVNHLINYERELAKYRPESKKASRWIEMPPFLITSELPLLHTEDLSWLLETSDRNLLGRLMAARNGYLAVLSLIKQRIEIKGRVDEHIEKKIQNAGLHFQGRGCSESFLREHLTDRQEFELRQSTETLLTMNSDVIHDHFEVIEAMHVALKQIWPKSIFIKLGPKEALLKKWNISLPEPSKHLSDKPSEAFLSFEVDEISPGSVFEFNVGRVVMS